MKPQRKTFGRYAHLMHACPCHGGAVPAIGKEAEAARRSMADGTRRLRAELRDLRDTLDRRERDFVRAVQTLERDLSAAQASQARDVRMLLSDIALAGVLMATVLILVFGAVLP